MNEPRRWLYGLTADEWLHLACEGNDSEVGPCCGVIAELREELAGLAICQAPGEADWFAGEVLDTYAVALDGHDTLADAAKFPLLHRVLKGIRAELVAAEGVARAAGGGD